jgi:hypothetical protein
MPYQPHQVVKRTASYAEPMPSDGQQVQQFAANRGFALHRPSSRKAVDSDKEKGQIQAFGKTGFPLTLRPAAR